MTEADGVLERSGDVSILRFRRRLRHPVEAVWAALTEDEHLEGWFPTTIEGARVAGAPLPYAFRQGQGESFEGQMRAFEPPSLMELRWADDVLRFELEAEGSGCVLSLTVSFSEYGKAARDATGWHVCLEQLSFVCAGAPLPWSAAGALASGPSALRGAARGRGLGHRTAPGWVRTHGEASSGR